MDISTSFDVTYRLMESKGRVTAFVNGHKVGNLRIRGNRLIFRDSRNPFTNFFRNANYEGLAEMPINRVWDIVLGDRFLMTQLHGIVVRNYARNYMPSI